MRRDRASIYERELQRLHDAGAFDGLTEDEAAALRFEAAENAEQIYWDLVDQGRQMAKDREGERK